MIEPTYYGIGFIIYVFYILITFDIFSKKEGNKNIFIYILIYFYISLLAGYVINFVDKTSGFFEKFVQMGIYFVIGGIIVFQHFNNINKDSELEEYEYEKSKLF
jgi:glycerol-3-phosphate acyltransferase PlsY